MLKIFIAFASILCLVDSQSKNSYTEQWFREAGFGDQISPLPYWDLGVYYGNKKASHNYFTPREVRYQPTVPWGGSTRAGTLYYTLMMIDLDAGKYTQVLHWLVTNIDPADFNSGTPIKDYMGAAPSDGSGYHRYAFLVYRQKEKITDKLPVASSRSFNDRLNFDANKFAQKYKLEGPVWGNYMFVKYDSYVDEFYDEYMEEFG